MVLVSGRNMILLDFLKVSIVLYLYVGWNSFEVTFRSQLEDPVPICFIVTLDRSYAECPGAIYSGVFLHAVVICTIINLDFFKMKPHILLLYMCHPDRLRKVHEEL